MPCRVSATASALRSSRRRRASWPTTPRATAMLAAKSSAPSSDGAAKKRKQAMSRIGKKPIVIPTGVTAKLEGQTIAVKGAKGELKFTAPQEVALSIDGGAVHVEPQSQEKRARAMWGMTRAQVANLVGGVTKGFEKKLEISGVGYKAALQGKNLQLALGYSHDVVYAIPEGITIVVPKPTEITITGNDSQRVGQVAAEIRAYRPPEPYKGKGVKYANEFIFRKEGKKK